MLALAWLGAAALVAALCAVVMRAGRTRERRGFWPAAARRFRANPWATGALCFLIAVVVVAALAPWLAPHDPIAQPDIVALRNRPPSAAFPFGTDFASRDVFSRVLFGARVSLSVSVLAVLLSATVGAAYGAIAGYYGGAVDELLMRLLDAALSLPRLLILIVVLVLWGGVDLPALVLLIGLTGWFGVSRLVRAEVLSLRDRDLVAAARALGARDVRILWRHILPSALSPLIVATTLGIGQVILLEAGLSYLGIGVRPPLASWGNLIRDGADQLPVSWWLTVFPGLAIVLTVMAVNVVGDGLRDALDPRQLDG